MKLAVLGAMAFCGLVQAGDDLNATFTTVQVAASVSTGSTPAAPAGKAGKGKGKGKNGKAAKGKAPTASVAGQTTERQLILPGSPAPVAASYAAPASYAASATVAFPVPVRPPLRSCPYNNCNSCTNQVGCYWTGMGCTSFPCTVNGGPCAFAPAQCGGCTSNSQCGGTGRRCQNGMCLGVVGDKSCDYYVDCGSCLANPNCLWDPNTLWGTCKPKEQCDFTYQQRELVLTPAAAAPPATACVKSLDRCSQTNFNGAVLDPNAARGVGCTNHGQCAGGQYCYSCSKCKGNCYRCKAPGVAVSGMCGPAARCPFDGDSIDGTCPIVYTPIAPPVVVPPPIVVPQPTCSSFLNCGPCTAQVGCVWSGISCYYTTVPCTNRGCANTPQQCNAVVVPPAIPPPTTTNCAYNNCYNCAATQGCVWSGQFCYYAVAPCNTPGCANNPNQCGGCTRDSQCGTGGRCSSGQCVGSAGDRTCDWYMDCVSCLADAGCLWDPNSNTHCKPKEQCDFTVRGLSLTGATPPPATACIKTVDKCGQTNFNGAILDPNQNRGAGCTNHGQCLNGQYCFSCSKCRGDCAPCNQGGAPVSGACGPASQCPVDGDSINGLCPVVG